MQTFSALLALLRGIRWSPVDSPHNGQWHGALMLSLLCAWINYWINSGNTCHLRCHNVHVTSLLWQKFFSDQTYNKNSYGAEWYDNIDSWFVQVPMKFMYRQKRTFFQTIKHSSFIHYYGNGGTFIYKAYTMNDLPILQQPTQVSSSTGLHLPRALTSHPAPTLAPNTCTSARRGTRWMRWCVTVWNSINP